MRQNVFETVLGAVVLLAAILFLSFAYDKANVKAVSGYTVKAAFQKIDGIKVGSDVQVSGIKVGNVSHIGLDKNYRAVLDLTVGNDVQLPKDTAAVVASSGMLGDKFISLEPGGDEDMLKAGESITITQSPPGLEQLLGQVIFSLNKQTEKKE